MAWILLAVGVIIATVANALLRMSDGFSHIWYGVASFILFGVAIYLYGIAIKTLPISVAYAVWSGAGVLVLLLVGVVWFGEELGLLKVFFMAMILVGCIGLNLTTKV